MNHATLEPLRHERDRGRIVGKLREVSSAMFDVTAPQKGLTVIMGQGSTGLFDICFPEVVLHESGAYECIAGDLTRTAFRDIASRLNVPLAYLDRLCSQGHCDLADTNLNTLSSRDERTALYRLMKTETDWILRSVQSDRYRSIDNTDLLVAVTRGLAESGIDLFECDVEADWTNDRFRLRIVVPQIQVLADDLVGDYRWPFSFRDDRGIHDPGTKGETPPLLFAGLEISNSETGNGSATITPRAEWLVCRNGMTRTQDMIRNVHLGGKLDQGVVAWSHETHRKALELISSQVADATSKFLSVGFLEMQIAEMRAAKGIEVASVTQAVAVVKERLGFSEDEIANVLDCFTRGGDTTVLGLGQAVTAAAQLVPDSDRQSEIEAAFWAIVGEPKVFAAA